jgi:pSer/pThr/pTyr-binding forkhead associated (FHA) protein
MQTAAMPQAVLPPVAAPIAAPAIAPAAPLAPMAAPAIAPARVVDLGSPPAPKPATRICARCRGSCDATAQFCKFCGAPLADTSGPPSITGPTMQAARDRVPYSAVPDTPAMDPRAYPPAMSAAARSSTAQHQAPTARPPAPDPRAETGLMSPVTIPARGRIVIIARDGGEGPSFPLAQGEGESTDIGRIEGDVVLADDRYISPRHARLQRRGEHVLLRDLGSVNGIYLRIPSGIGGAMSTPPPPPAELGTGGGLTPVTHLGVDLMDQDLFLVGQQVLRFEVVNDAEEGYGTASQHGTLMFGTPAAPRYARLSQRTVEGVTRDVFYIRKVETVLGRESGDIVFTEDPFLSRRHAAIRYDRDKKKFSLSDLGSSNGTFLQIREEVRLKDGDHFRIGQQLFRLDLDASAKG